MTIPAAIASIGLVCALASASELKPIALPREFAEACVAGPARQKIFIKQFEFNRTFEPALKKSVGLRAYAFYLAGAKGKRPAVAMFHGGGWRGGNPTHWFPQAAYFASRGAIAISFQYRIEEVHGPSPNIAARAATDARSAMKWLSANADQLGIDAKRVAVTGDSAGGHLALMIALEKEPLAPRAAVPLYPVVDTERLDDGPGKPPLNFSSVSPIRLVGAKRPLAPTQIILGEADENLWTVPARTLAFCAKADGENWNKNDLLSNSPCRVDLIPEPPRAAGAKPRFGHAFMANPVAYRRMMKSMDAYLVERGVLAGPEKSESARAECVSNVESIARWTQEFGYANGGGVW